MEGISISALVTAIAAAISNRLSTDNITLLATVFNQLGDTLATIALQRTLTEQRRAAQCPTPNVAQEDIT